MIEGLSRGCDQAGEPDGANFFGQREISFARVDDVQLFQPEGCRGPSRATTG